jgi:hypothetical protein
MMSGRAYAIRLALVVFIFAVVMPPVLAVLAFYSLAAAAAHSARDLVWGFIIFLAIAPLWVLCFAIALWLAVYPRTRTIGLPFWMPLLVLILLAADWRFLDSLRSSPWPSGPFLLGAFALLIALAFWPERAEGASPRTFANDCAIWALAGLGVLACASFVGSLIEMTIGTMMAVQIAGYARFAARWWVFLAIGAMIFTIVAGRRKIPRG